MTLAQAHQAEHRVADRIAPVFRRTYEEHVELARRALPSFLEEAFEMGSAEVVIRSLPWMRLQEILFDGAIKAYRELIEAAAKAHRRLLPISRLRKATPSELSELGFVFDGLNPRALRFVQEHAAELVRFISASTQSAIRDIIVRMFSEGIPPERAARLLREIVGLLPRHANAVANYQRNLLEAGLSEEQIDQRVKTYARRLRMWRARAIARTESIRGSAFGQQELWMQALDQGFLETDQTRRKWLITPDERLCPVCAPVPSLPPVRLTEPFQLGDGRLTMNPPAHVFCRCAVRLVFANEQGAFPPPDQPTPAFAGRGRGPSRRLKPKIPSRR